MNQHHERIAVVWIDRDPHGAVRSGAGDREKPDGVDRIIGQRNPVDAAVDRLGPVVREGGHQPVVIGVSERDVDGVAGGEALESDEHAVGAWVFGPHVWSLA